MQEKTVILNFLLILFIAFSELCFADQVQAPAGCDSSIVKELKNSFAMTFVYIEPGRFRMGSPLSEKGRDRNEIQRMKTLQNGFYIQTTEVSQGQWISIMGNNPAEFDNCGTDCPIDNISWNEIQIFVDTLNQKDKNYIYRLPTEVEWEYVCRSGNMTPFYTGQCLPATAANYNGNEPFSGCRKGEFRERTLPVGSFAPNAWGVFDMHGNVKEFCSAKQPNYLMKTILNNKTWGKDPVLRGGSWLSSARKCRSAFRYHVTPNERSNEFGFRLVCVTADEMQ